tara:strand:- start:978 stop:1421 length:444 start_codon:yes stop_codon:yes gene_type:complete
MTQTIPYIKADTFDQALAIHADITGTEFYAGYENCNDKSNREFHTPEGLNNTQGYYVAETTGDIYYIYTNVTKNGRYGAGEMLFHKLSIHTSIGAGPFSLVVIHEEFALDCGTTLGSNEITIIQKDWDRGQPNRKHFAKHHIIVTTL